QVIAELIGTYFLIFAGCCSVVINNAEETKGRITFPGICLVWGFSVTILVYSLAHVSGAHFNPAVTLSFAIYRHFPLRLAFSTDNRAIGKLGGIAVGMTIIVNVFIAGPISGASMNPARSLGPALVMWVYNGIWIYVVGPFVGAILGATCYNLIRYTDKPLREIGASSKIFKTSACTSAT
ncbi:Putative aquaporin NIP4-1, partial [Glycine soja]